MHLPRLLIATVLFFALSHTVQAQTKRIEKLKRDILRSSDSREKLRLIFALCEEGYSLHPDTLMSYAIDGMDIAKANNLSPDEITAAYYQSYALTNKGLIDSSLALANSCLAALPGKLVNSVLAGNLKNQKGRCFMRKNQYKEAIAMAYQVIEAGEKNSDTLLQMKGKTLAGWAYLEMGQTSEALAWHLKALRTAEDSGTLSRYGILFANLALNYNGLGKPDSAMFYIGKAIAFSRQHENLFALSNSLAIEAQLFVKTNQVSLAEEPLKEVIAIRKLIGDPFYIVSDMSQLALYYAHNGQPDKGIALCKEGIAIARRYQIETKLFFLYSTLAENYKAKNDMPNYAATLENIIALKDSVYQSNSAEVLVEMRARYEVQKKENLIIRQQLDLTKKNYLFYGTLLFILIVGLILYGFFREYKKRERMKMHMMMEEEKRVSAAAVIEAKESQRKKISADLHDNLGVQANAILYGTELLLTDRKANEALVGELHDTAKDMLLTLRETLWAMKHADVPAENIWLRVISFSKQMSGYYTSLQISTMGFAPKEFILNSGRALNAVLIVQEAVNNAARHSFAKTIRIKTESTADSWSLHVIDDGTGFDLLANKKKEDSYGLNNMEERAKAAGLRLLIQSESGKGTIISLIIPSRENVA